MSATKENARVAAAFQGGKDPQQDAILQWLGSLPKDERGGIRRSVMKYHLTQALLLYINIPPAQAGRAIIPTIASTPVVGKDSPSILPTAAPSSPIVASSPVVPSSNSTTEVKPANRALRSKIAGSMKQK